MRIENSLKDIRIKRKITQTALAEGIGKSLRFIQFLEKGERDFTRETLINLSRELGCSPIDILPDYRSQDDLYEKIQSLTNENRDKIEALVDDYLALQGYQSRGSL